MKRILLLMSVLILPMFLTAQDDEIDNLPFDNEPLRDDARTYFVLAGGVTYDFLMLKEDNLNSFLNNSDELKLSGPIQLTGGQGVLGVPWIKNLRLGVFGYGGSLESDISKIPGKTESGEDIINSFQTNLTASMFGFSVHYGYVPFEHFAILGGINAGWGDVTYESHFSTDQLYDSFSLAGTGNNRLEKNYFFVMPNIQLEYAITSFIIMRADASYNLTVGQDTDWTYNSLGTNTVNPDFNLDGMKVGFGVMIGLANF